MINYKIEKDDAGRALIPGREFSVQEVSTLRLGSISVDKLGILIGSPHFGFTRRLAGSTIADLGRRLISTEHLCYFHREFRAEFISARDAM